MQINNNFYSLENLYTHLGKFNKLTYDQQLITYAMGIAAADLTGIGIGLNAKSQAELLKISSCAISLIMGIHGINSLRSVTQPSTLWSKAKALAWGSVSLSQNIGAILLINSLNSKVITVASRCFYLSTPCQVLIKQGFWNTTNGSCKIGISKFLLGAAGTAAIGYYAYSNLMIPSLEWDEPNTLSEEKLAILESYKEQIENLYTCEESCGDWTKLGKGMTKKAFIHPDLPGMLVKIQLDDSLGGDLRFRNQYYNLQNLKEITKMFDRIVLPESHVFPTSKGLAIVEEKFDFTESYDRDSFLQFLEFEAKTGLCDVLPNWKHNAGYLSSGKIGIIDMDCQDLTNQHSIGIWSMTGSVVGLTGVAAVAKKIANMNPDRILSFGLLLSGLVAYSQYDSGISLQYQLEELGKSAAISMGLYAAAELGLATIQAVNNKINSCSEKEHTT